MLQRDERARMRERLYLSSKNGYLLRYILMHFFAILRSCTFRSFFDGRLFFFFASPFFFGSFNISSLTLNEKIRKEGSIILAKCIFNTYSSDDFQCLLSVRNETRKRNCEKCFEKMWFLFVFGWKMRKVFFLSLFRSRTKKKFVNFFFFGF